MLHVPATPRPIMQLCAPHPPGCLPAWPLRVHVHAQASAALLEAYARMAAELAKDNLNTQAIAVGAACPHLWPTYTPMHGARCAAA